MIVAVVAHDIPVTIPEELTVATAVLLLLQVPPGVASVSAVVEPTQRVSVPAIGAGLLFAVMVSVAKQPVPDV